jgi:oligoendopeptidase F
MQMVKKACQDFSPTMYKKICEIETQEFIDAPLVKGKVSGAFNCSFKTPKQLYSYIFLNYVGTQRDVETLAHELGHGVHGLLAGEAQGGLQMHAPMAIAETASIFGESLVFEEMLKACQNKKQKLVMLMNKARGFINSVVRQISFSEFEQVCHNARRSGKLTTEDFSHNWLEVCYKFYGKENDVFHYEDMQNLWSYVGHFMRPFYVYAYAYGELFTQSLLAAKDKVTDFENKYVELLQSGNTKTAVELMKPFNLNPEDDDFWHKGIENSLGLWITQAQEIYMEIKDEING